MSKDKFVVSTNDLEFDDEVLPVTEEEKAGFNDSTIFGSVGYKLPKKQKEDQADGNSR